MGKNPTPNTSHLEDTEALMQDGGSSDVELRWLKDCVPVFMQPEHDIALGHPLVCLFYSFQHDVSTGELLCEMLMVYEGEASYRRLSPLRMNRMATFFYMSFNRVVWGRTADVNYMTVRGVELDWQEKGCLPWRSIRSTDYCGEQTWSQGKKGNLGSWLSLFYHYRADIPCSEFELEIGTHRPFVYVNTANHLIGNTNANPDLKLQSWREYPTLEGESQAAEHFCRTKIISKPTVFNPFPRLVHRMRTCFTRLPERRAGDQVVAR